MPDLEARLREASHEQGRYRDAERNLEASMSMFPVDPQDLRRADLDDELAGVYEYLGKSAAAERVYRDAVTIPGHRPDAPPRDQP